MVKLKGASWDKNCEGEIRESLILHVPVGIRKMIWDKKGLVQKIILWMIKTQRKGLAGERRKEGLRSTRDKISKKKK